ncbi:PKD domain-containing protein, partial [Candidatus Bipolaricaulota bacterium]|nr:PKD domain-containing protein [Candidatus Bipolaricaulota bacterium]
MIFRIRLLRSRLLAGSLCLGLLLVGGCSLFRSNGVPIAVIGATIVRGYAPLEAAFDGRSSTDPDGELLSYAWDFGDGANAAGPTVARTYVTPGTYDVRLRVVDDDGAEDTATLVIEVLEIPDGYVALRFEWVWEGETQRFDSLVAWSLYQTYRGRLRIPFVDNYDYGAYVEDPLDDPTLGDLADLLWTRAGGTRTAYTRYVLGFVQSAIAYQADPPSAEWPLYPIETLVDRVGDCEDASILYVSLLRERGVACKLAFVDTDNDRTPDHVLAFVPFS